MAVLAIDFDNTIASARLGPPMEGAKSAMELLQAQGHKIIIHTCRATNEIGARSVQDWLIHHQIPFHKITAIKPDAAIYLDDRAIRFTSWPDFTAYLSTTVI